MNSDSAFIQAVHRKILQKKQQRIKWSGFIVVAIGLFIFYSSNVSKLKVEDENWSMNELYQSEYYEWEYLEELTDEELLIYLIDTVESDEILELANNSAKILLAMQSINWEK
jgi:hypothetical protein